MENHDDVRFSISVIDSDGLGWGTPRSPIPNLADNSPFSEFGSDNFSDVEIGGSLQASDSPLMSMDDLNTGTSTALAHGFGNIQLAGQGEGRVSYGIPVAHSGVRDPTRETYKFKSASDAWASLNSTGDWGGTPDYASFMGAKPDYFSTTGQNYRLGHDALSINTDCFPVPPGSLMNEPLSAFSDHTGSAINSTPLHSSSSPTKCRGKESLWASASAPYPPPDQRKHRSSSLSKPDFTENPTRKRSWSDTRLRPAGNAPTPDTPSCFLDVPKRGSYVQAYSWDPQGESQSPSSLDFVESSNRSTNAVFMTDEHSRSPTFIYHQASPQTPVENTGAEQGSSSLSTHVSPGFKAQVASAAVVKAAQKKRRNQNGKVFGCDMCSAQLTTKQNLQYHIASHLGKREYSCEKCGKSFTTPHVRTRHESRCRGRSDIASGPFG